MNLGTINPDLRIIYENNEGTNNSLVYFLDQENSFNEQAFWQLYNSIVGLIEKPESDVVNREFARILCRIHAHILNCFIQHLLPGEAAGSKIVDLPLEKIESYIERFEYAVDGYFTGLVVDEKQLEQVDGLHNPKLNGNY
jgi:hypothetical protein